ncbi:MAG: hypothetical protein HC880_08200 [Bacteroidia bacterium]|nr:hypothetical protein [Bacteroidia bacterium]
MYKHIFFDLDHTLWDFESNSKSALTEIFHGFRLSTLESTIQLDVFWTLFGR